MARRRAVSRAEAAIWAAMTPFVLVAVVLGLLLAAIARFFEVFGWLVPLFVAALALFGYSLLKASRTRKKQRAELERQRQAAQEARRAGEQKRRAARAMRERLLAKYGDPAVVAQIARHRYWQGQTAEQLRDSLGAPVDTDARTLKTKTKEIWKYRQLGANRYRLRVTLEDGVVVAWDEKA